MVKRSSSITSQEDKYRSANDRDEVEGQENDELHDLSERERRINSGYSWLSEPTNRVIAIRNDDAGGGNQFFISSLNENSIKYVYKLE